MESKERKMKRKAVMFEIIYIMILTLIGTVFTLSLSGCDNVEGKTELDSYTNIYEDDDFKVEQHNLNQKGTCRYVLTTITIDKRTGVQYIEGRPLIDSEGNLLLYKGE